MAAKYVPSPEQRARYRAQRRAKYQTVRLARIEAQKIHYRANRDRYRQQARDRAQEHRALLRAIKDSPCTDCGLRYPHYVMQFDHAHGPKRANVAGLTSSSLGRVVEELSRCDVVCANCHSARTHARRTGEMASGLPIQDAWWLRA